MCGNNNLLKQDGMYVCLYCGTKYTVEEAKKLMIEGTVNVQGTVQIDNRSFVEKYLANARRARDKQDWEEVEKYYNLVEQNEPNNIEAVFYSAFGKTKMAMIDKDIFRREQICGVLCRSISVIDDYYDTDKSSENQSLIIQMHCDLMNMYQSDFVFNQKVNAHGIALSNDKNLTYYQFALIANGFIESLENIIKKDNQPVYWRLIFEQERYLITNEGIGYEDKVLHRERAVYYEEQIKQMNPSFQGNLPTLEGGCYVATCVYGSYDCPPVWTLRRYRDYTLAKTWYGRAFVRAYYAISPTLVRWFGKTKWFRNMWKPKLDRMVKRLNDEGVEDTPYHDRQW